MGYANKQAIVETKDEIEALQTEKGELDFKKYSGILSEEEEKRKDKLLELIKKAKANQRQNQFAMHALGIREFNFGQNANSKNKKKQRRELQANKFYVIDIINMMENNQKYSQQHLKQLATLYRKTT